MEHNDHSERGSSPTSSSSPSSHPFQISRLHRLSPVSSNQIHSHEPISLTINNNGNNGNLSPSQSPPHNYSLNNSQNHPHSHEENSPSPPPFNSQGFPSPSGRRLSSGLSCVVCGDTSSGKHYGILACNGCSGFFKRSVRRKLIYRCQAGTGNCIVDKAHRNQCQSCRLRKCLNMGMNKDAVQNERQPRNTATLRPESLCEMDQERALREAAVAVGVFGPLLGQRAHSASLAITAHAHSLSSQFHHHHHHQIPPPPMLLSSTSNESIHENEHDDDEDSIDVTSDENTPSYTTLNQNKSPSPPLVSSGPNSGRTPMSTSNNKEKNGHLNQNVGNGSNLSIPNHPPIHGSGRVSNNGVHSTTAPINYGTTNGSSNNTSSIEIPSAIYNPAHETIYETSARLLFMAVKWAKNLPSFGSLPFRDQVILLEESWADLFLLNAIQWCLPGDSVSLFSTSDHLSHLPNGKITQVAGDLRALNDTLLRFRAIGVDPAEFACLKAIALFRSDTRSLKDPLQVENLQDQAQVMLNSHSRSAHSSQPARFGRLLLMLPLLRTVPPQRIELLFFQRTIGNTPMEKVLCDMYKN